MADALSDPPLPPSPAPLPPPSDAMTDKKGEGSTTRHTHSIPAPSFRMNSHSCFPWGPGDADVCIKATHNSPRTWFITSALSPLIIRLLRLLLAHGDYVVACLPPHEIENDDRSAEFRELINECKSSRKDREGWKDRIRGIRCDGRVMGQCGAAVAEAVQVFGRIDILLCCKSEGSTSLPSLARAPAWVAMLTLVQLWWAQSRSSP